MGGSPVPNTVPTGASAPAAAGDNEELLARLLGELAEQTRRGQPADLKALVAAHPELTPPLVTELRELWAAAQFAEEFARKGTDSGWRPARKKPEKTPSSSAITNHQSPAATSFGDYDLLEELGRGGMGIVYKAWQRSLRRTVALKMILPGRSATEADQARFHIEVMAAAQLDHPHIVPVFEAGECEGKSYFSMRYIEGPTLASLLRQGPLKARDAARYLAAVARAVDFAHRRGILHRDLKPSNILIDNDQPLISDFGLAKRVPGTENVPLDSGLTLSGAIMGTPAYMAPEQVSGSRGTLSPASDVYSLGVILYEMLTGRPPFQAPTPVDTLLLVLDQDPVRPSLLNPKVDPDLELICLKCLQKEPELRYTTAAALADDLDAFLSGETLSVRRSTLADLGGLFGRLFRETHHAVVLENWGMLWMCHSIKILLQCVLTTIMAWNGVSNPYWYLLLWGGGLMAWGAVFWKLRKRAGPVLFIERQIAHVWASAIAATIGVFVIEMLLGLPVLTLAPMLAVIAGMTFIVKGGMLTGAFYLSAAAMFGTAIPMALYPDYGPLMFGVMTAVCFFIPGLKYHRQRRRTLLAQREEQGSVGRAFQPDSSDRKSG
jgi:serine/threonine-protein kinase